MPGGISGKELASNAGDVRNLVGSLGQEDPLEEGMGTHASILAWRIPWSEEPIHGITKSWIQLK